MHTNSNQVPGTKTSHYRSEFKRLLIGLTGSFVDTGSPRPTIYKREYTEHAYVALWGLMEYTVVSGEVPYE